MAATYGDGDRRSGPTRGARRGMRAVPRGQETGQSAGPRAWVDLGGTPGVRGHAAGAQTGHPGGAPVGGHAPDTPPVRWPLCPRWGSRCASPTWPVEPGGGVEALETTSGDATQRRSIQ